MFILCMYTVNTEKIASYPFHVDATPKKPYDAFSTITITTENNNGEHLNIVEIFWWANNGKRWSWTFSMA